MKRIIIYWSLIMIIILNYCGNIWANEKVKVCNTILNINGENFITELPIININGYSYISVYDAKRIFGYDYNLDMKNLRLTLSYENVNKEKENINNYENVCLDFYIENACLGKSYIYNSKIYVPLRAIAVRNSGNIYFIDEENCIQLNYNILNVFGRNPECIIGYMGSLGYNYIFIVYSDVIDNSKSVMMIKYYGNYKSNYESMKDFIGSLSINGVSEIRIVDIDKEQYAELNNKIYELLNDEYKGSDTSEGIGLGYYAVDYFCYIIQEGDNYRTAFESENGIKMTVQYNELKNYFKSLSGYEMQYITPFNE